MNRTSVATIIAIILLVLTGIVSIVGLIAILGVLFDYNWVNEIWIDATMIGLFAPIGNFVALIFAVIGHVRSKNTRSKGTLIAVIVLLQFSVLVVFIICYGLGLFFIKAFLTLLGAWASFAR